MTHKILMKGTETVIAEGSDAQNTVLDFEGNWYFSPDVVDMTHLTITERTYNCPYKGICFWIDLDSPERKAKNIAWVYVNPVVGYEHIRNRIAFYSRETAGTVAAVVAHDAEVGG